MKLKDLIHWHKNYLKRVRSTLLIAKHDRFKNALNEKIQMLEATIEALETCERDHL